MGFPVFFWGLLNYLVISTQAQQTSATPEIPPKLAKSIKVIAFNKFPSNLSKLSTLHQTHSMTNAEPLIQSIKYMINGRDYSNETKQKPFIEKSKNFLDHINLFEKLMYRQKHYEINIFHLIQVSLNSRLNICIQQKMYSTLNWIGSK